MREGGREGREGGSEGGREGGREGSEGNRGRRKRGDKRKEGLRYTYIIVGTLNLLYQHKYFSE